MPTANTNAATKLDLGNNESATIGVVPQRGEAAGNEEKSMINQEPMVAAEAGERVVTNGEWTSAEKAYAEARRALLDARGDLRMGTEERRRIERTCELARANVEGLCQFAPLEAVGCLSPGHDCAAARKATAARTAAKGRADDDR